MSHEAMAESDGAEGLAVSDVEMVFGTREPKTVALRGCTLHVPVGKRAALIGTSGCGKSTLLRILAGLAEPTSGTASVDQMPPSEARKARRYALVSQKSVMLPWRRLLSNVELGLEVMKLGKTERRERSMEAIELVGLAGFEQAYPHELSGGMRQRAAIARALTLRPRYLLMDEPFGALDELTRETLNFELLRVLDETQATLLLVTHSIPESVILSDMVAVMSPRPGRIVHTIDVAFREERSPEIRDDPLFADYEAEVRHHLLTGVA